MGHIILRALLSSPFRLALADVRRNTILHKKTVALSAFWAIIFPPIHFQVSSHSWLTKRKSVTPGLLCLQRLLGGN